MSRTQTTTTKTKPNDIAELLGDPVLIPISLFDQLGHVRKDLSSDTELVEQMGGAQRGLLMSTLSACQAAEQSEQKISDLRLALNRKIHEHDLCVLAADKANPPISHQVALQNVVAAHAGREQQRRRVADPKPAAALKLAHDELTALRLEFQSEQLKLRELSRLRGAAIGKWVREGQPILTDETVRRQYMQRSAEERLGRAVGTIVDPVVAPVKTWPIEASFKARDVKRKQQYFGPR